MSLQRSATRKAAAGPARRKKDYDIVQQGIKELYPLDKSDVEPEIDIVFVPGLGAHPEDSWKSESTGFNWTTDGLVRDFPRARILLYMYESAWTGSLKVKQFMSNVAMTLLNGLRSKREGAVQRRPIVFIGHSMGGLVVAKAITIADSRRDKFPVMFEAIAAAIFFGAPFNGAPVASVAAMYAYLAEKAGTASTSKLLDLMKPGDEGLRELKHEFMRLVGKLSPKIDLLCFYEEQPTDFGKMAGLPDLFGISKLVIPKSYADFVSRDSATLPGVEEQGLARNHRDLVKFDGPKDDQWNQFVKDPLKRIIHGAQLAVKNRLNSVRDIDRKMINNIMEALDGAQVSKKRRALAQTFASSSWITKEEEYKQWLSDEIKTGDEANTPRAADCLWIRGPEGRGKTSASLATVDEIDRIKDTDSNKGPVLLAYFFCESTTDYCTAEDVLKSIVTQLIDQQEMLASYAKLFAKKRGEGNKPQVTVENLWQTIQDMLIDEFIGSKVIFVLNNLHVLPEDSDSTIKLMKYLNAELQGINHTDTKRVPTRWMITSREAHNIEEALKIEGVRLVDLEDEKYGNQVQTALRKRAKERVTTLEKEKNYNKALAYFASSLIGKRAQNTQWIDITCVQLQELPEAESDLKVRRILERMPQDLTTLLNNSWLQIFKANEAEVEKIKEMLRALVLTYEDPTEEELGVLAGFSSSEEEKSELRKFVEMCKPLLAIKRANNTISFMNVVVKTHLLENAKQLLGMSDEEKKWQHGVLALRSFSHVNESFNFPGQEETPDSGEDGNSAKDDQDEDENEEAEEDEEEDDDEEDDDEDDDDDEYDSESEPDSQDEVDPEADILRDLALPYTVKYWLRHASKATREIAEDLSLEEDFWKSDSKIRHRWLVEYWRMTSTFDGFDYKTLTGLHIAASVGFRELVAALIRNGYEDQIKIRDSLVNSPLHFAAYFGRPKIVEELLNRGAAIDDGDEIQEQTPLHMAAFGGHVEVMKKLLLRGANANAMSNDIGPVVNAAISSGNRACVELLIERNVSLTVDRADIDAPLALAALLSDFSMFEYLIERYADKLPPEEYSKAFVKAAEAGRLEVFNRMLEYEHTQEYFQLALGSAVDEGNWDIVTIILEKCQGLDVDGAFYQAATGTEQQDKLLDVFWNYSNGTIGPDTLNNCLYDATDREKESTVRLLLEKFKADPNATGDEYGNALTAAAYDGTMEIIEMLLNAGANVNAPEGWALQTAATEGHYDVVVELLKRGADVNAFTDSSYFESGTAIQGACEAGKTDIVSLLLEHNADPNLGGGRDAPPIIAAALRAEEDILELLVKAKAHLDVHGSGGCPSTPLSLAAAYMPLSSLQLLLDAGADINLPDEDGDTALIAAASRGDEEAVSFLINNGADIMHSNEDGENALQMALATDNEECLKVLVDRVSVLLSALKNAMDSGNNAVTSVVRGAFNKEQELSYDDEPQVTPKNVESPKTSVSDVADRQHEETVEEVPVIPDENDIRSSIYSNEAPLPDDDDHAAENDTQDAGTSEEQSSFDQISERLKSAIANQAALWNEFTTTRSTTPTEVGQPAYQPNRQENIEAYQPNGQTEENIPHRIEVEQGPQQTTSDPIMPDTLPIELPAHEYIKRKPAPTVPYDNQATYSQSHSPGQSQSSASQIQASVETRTYDQTITAYRPDPVAASQQPHEIPSYQNPQSQTIQPESSVSYQHTHAYTQSQSAQIAAQYQSSAPYQPNNSLYENTNQVDATQSQPPTTQYPAQQPTYAAYNPGTHSPPQQGSAPQQSYNPSNPIQAYQGQAYQPQDWQQQYQGYYGNAQNQQYTGNAYDGSDWEQGRPQLKPQRSSFFGNGMKNTLNKTKIMGNGIFNRK